MIESSLFLGVFMFCFGGLAFMLQTNHLLNCLLSLEMMVLSLFFITFVLFTVLSFDYLFPLVLLCFGAAEASIGLALLVSLIRFQGSDGMGASSFKC
uniref:NADH-ubiquinone oxidoreductase chain 4L n=1 Tax=Psilodens balduri TaxID=1494734 RepID=A0A2U8LL49_9MOLL|nr:NADH dehydrogenase subunit 4L [Psilodens balduri]